MATNLFLVQSRAQKFYRCEGCKGDIPKGSPHFRHDPINIYRTGKKRYPTTHWCIDCISTSGAWLDPNNGRLRVSVLQVLSNRIDSPKQQSLPLFARVELLGVGGPLSPLLERDPALVHALSATQFQEFLCERLDAMGFEPRQVGDTYQRDGGIDILFWPRRLAGFPFLGALQAKHHQLPTRKEGPSAVRDFAGVVAGHPINVGLMVTNTSFTADAQWFARNKAPLLRLRDFNDIQRWLSGNFNDADEWRDLPDELEVCPGLMVPIGKRRDDT